MSSETEHRQTTEPRDHLIRKGAVYYRQGYCGYTADHRTAGRYTKAEAESEAQTEPWHMQAVPVASLSPDPRVKLVEAHFLEWHGAAPDLTEIEALLERIDGRVPA